MLIQLMLHKLALIISETLETDNGWKDYLMYFNSSSYNDSQFNIIKSNVRSAAI